MYMSGCFHISILCDLYALCKSRPKGYVSYMGDFDSITIASSPSLLSQDSVMNTKSKSVFHDVIYSYGFLTDGMCIEKHNFWLVCVVYIDVVWPVKVVVNVVDHIVSGNSHESSGKAGFIMVRFRSLTEYCCDLSSVTLTNTLQSLAAQKIASYIVVTEYSTARSE